MSKMSENSEKIEKMSKKVEILNKSTKIKKSEEIDVRVKELAEWGPG